MSDILTTDQVAEMLGCTPETVREKTPHLIPGAKFGRDWVYSRDLVVRTVEQEAIATRDRMRADQAAKMRSDIALAVTKGVPPSLTP